MAGDGGGTLLIGDAYGVGLVPIVIGGVGSGVAGDITPVSA